MTPTDARAGGTQPVSDVEPRKSPEEALERCLQLAWNDFCADTGCIPDAFTIHGPRTTRVVADFARGNFVRSTMQWLEAAGYEVVDRRG